MKKLLILAGLLCIFFAKSQTPHLNKSFGTKGFAPVYAGDKPGNVLSEVILKVFPLDDGKSLLVTTTGNYVQLSRRLESGKLDKTYGNEGYSESVKIIQVFPAGAAMQTDGKVVVTGPSDFT
ncbi:MAG: delta-60 repeat protein, partial [Chitinophagaceae bacterium]|nr:delta-60 repeat protein [Chitinophagaceae bacterium]